MLSPMEDQEPGECLRCSLHSPAGRALHGTVRHENNVFRFEHRIRSLPRQDLPQVNRSLLSFTALLIRTDDARFALRGGPSKTLTQSERLQDGNLLIRLQSKPPGPSHLANHVNNPSTPALDHPPGIYPSLVSWLSHLRTP